MSKAKNIVYLALIPQKTFADVGGDWSKRHLMKMSAAVTIQLPSERFSIFTEDNVTDLIASLCNANVVIGYGNCNFDFPILEGYGARLQNVPALDLFQYIADQSGLQIPLQAALEGTFRISSESGGLDKIGYWKTGRTAKVIESCMNQAHNIRRLHLYGQQHGRIFFISVDKGRRSVKVNW